MKNIEELFRQFWDCVAYLQKVLNVSLTEALIETFDNLETGKIKVENGAPDAKSVAVLSQKYTSLNYDKLARSMKTKLFSLLILKALTDDDRDNNQMPTPPIISTIMAMLMRCLVKKKSAAIVDPAVGSGTLLVSLIEQLIKADHSQNEFRLSGIDNDETILNLADVLAHLSGLKIDLYCQDAIESWMTKPADVIVSDLPVGYYPLDNIASKYDLHAKSGHSLAHLLYIEQIINHLAPGGYAFLLVPAGILSGKVGAEFMPWLGKKVYLNAIIQLSDKMFKSRFNEKAIVVLQNHGDQAQAREVLLTKLENLNQEESLLKFNVKLNEWYTKNYR